MVSIGHTIGGGAFSVATEMLRDVFGATNTCTEAQSAKPVTIFHSKEVSYDPPPPIFVCYLKEQVFVHSEKVF
jgi:hypothetical protein